MFNAFRAIARAKPTSARATGTQATVEATQATPMWQPAPAEPMTMQKVQILKKVGAGDSWVTVVDCAAQFNPEKLQLNKKASWKTDKTWKSNIGNTTFTGGDPISLSVELFFDTTATGGDVRQYTNPLMDLTMVDVTAAAQTLSEEEVKKRLEAKKKELESAKKTLEAQEGVAAPLTSQADKDDLLAPFRQNVTSLETQVTDLERQSKGRVAGEGGAPPKCKFVWGNFAFVAITESADVTFTMFLPNGTPVRAKAKLKMKQVEEQSLYPPQNPTTRSVARKLWVVREGETLDWIAYQEYRDPSLWRHLAEINNLDNPRDLRPGQVLNL